MAIRIRDAESGDEGPIGELLIRAFEHQYARKMPGLEIADGRKADLRDQAEKRANSTVLVAEGDDGEVVGTVAVYQWGAPRSEAWIPGAADIRLLGVDVAHQGKGISAPLLDEAERLARSWNVPAICLHVRRGLTGVARLYEGRGYEREAIGDIDKLPEVFLEAYVLRL